MTLINDSRFPQLQYFAADNIHAPGIAAVFTTRNGGVSGMTAETEHLRSMNLQYNAERDSLENVTENFRIITAALGFGADDVMQLWQKHSDVIITVDKESTKSRPQYKLDEADALVTDIKGILLCIRVADCVPILLYDPVKGTIGAAHAGWRGTLQGIGAKTVRRMNELYGTHPSDIQTAIGAAIGLCCFEVGFEVYEQFHARYGESVNRFFQTEQGKKPYCDIKAMNKAFLMEAGIPEQNISVSEMCTRCHPDLFFSHRRSGENRGTMAAFIGMKA